MIRIDLNDPRPLEEQIAAAIRQALARAELALGDELPPVRQLAADLGVHWNTVARAYRRLAEERLLLVRRGRGAIVRGDLPAATAGARNSLRQQLADAIAAGRVRGLTSREVATVFRDTLAQFEETRKP